MWDKLSPRIVVYLKRIAEALERANELNESRLKLDSNEFRRTGRVGGGGVRRVEISTPTIESWNENWEKRHSGEGEAG